MSIPIEERVLDHFILIYLPEHHRAYQSGYVSEQILIAEKYLGRDLFPDEEVKHINGKQRDNRPENLRVTSGSYKSLSLTEEVEQKTRVTKTYIPCKYQKVCWNSVRAPIARKNKIFLPYICSFQTEGEVYHCSRFWTFRENEGESSNCQTIPISPQV